MTKIKYRICKVKTCGKKYEVNPKYPLFPCCSFPCAIEYQSLLRKNKASKDWKIKKAEMKSNLMTHKDWVKLFQITFNTFIRLRDKELPCISCGAIKCEEFHAGHFIASTYQYLRFNEKNVHKQCSRCNTHLRGNIIPYRIELINRIGLNEVELLENSRHMMLKLSIPEIQEKIKYYKSLINKLK